MINSAASSSDFVCFMLHINLDFSKLRCYNCTVNAVMKTAIARMGISETCALAVSALSHAGAFPFGARRVICSPSGERTLQRRGVLAPKVPRMRNTGGTAENVFSPRHLLSGLFYFHLTNQFQTCTASRVILSEVPHRDSTFRCPPF